MTTTRPLEARPAAAESPRAPRPAGEAPPHLSPSAASTFNQCPRRWRYRYVDRLDDPAGDAALVGTLAHRVLELLLNEAPADRTTERARQLAGQAWPEVATHGDFQRLELDTEATRAFKWRAWKAIEGLWRLEDPAAVRVEATEQRLEVNLGGVPFVGVVDRVDRIGDQLVVTDYKSGRPPSMRFAEEKLDQVLLYAAAVALVAGTRPSLARLFYLGTTEIGVRSTPANLDRAVGRLADTWSGVQSACSSGSFPTRAGKLCAWCPFLDRCAEGGAQVQALLEDGWQPVNAPALARAA
ncbi:MAG: PD-(D/E)XK nuclease family protein [Acidimicrobiia bacterium]|nr:PD-(D/E)XK nuclease family protein [Acidimicrobiia bacterium]